MLAGLTQAELLKLSPELSVCVGGLEDEENTLPSRPREPQEVVQKAKPEGEKESNSDGTTGDGWRVRGKSGTERSMDVEEEEEERNGDESRDTLRTTSFPEMARRRKRNTGPTSDPYYSAGLSNTDETKANNMRFDTFGYSPVFSDSPPPPPPPRPLPPAPPSLTHPKACTLPANSARPERFDWLMAFTPEGEALVQPPPLETRKSDVETPKKRTTSSSSSSSSSSSLLRSSSGSGSKVTTFKELRLRNKNGSPPTKVINDPDPDPNVITPDPDILYNLKWRREKKDDDGLQWEYTSQAQAVFMQPPTLTSMAALREMLQRAKEEEEEGGQRESRPTQRIGGPASESNLWTKGGEREEEEEDEEEEVKRKDKEAEAVVETVVEEEEEEEEVEVEVRGRADGGRTAESRATAIRSVSFVGSEQKGGTSWMGENEKIPMRGLGLSSLWLQEKRGLVSAVSLAVEAILAQFSSSRTVVQKALSGDSSVNPSLGRLVLQCLCPALCSLLSDGLKPHQSDLIAGRRPNSAWGLVQASTKPGPSTQALYKLQARVGELPQLKQSTHRFNAFLLGLLNTKLLDLWLSHLQTCTDVLEAYYRPSSFMCLSSTSCQPLFEELLLLLQPLSLLTFNLDLLFQHHHLEPANHSPEMIPSPPNQDLGHRLSPRGSISKARGGSYLEGLSELDFGGSPERQAANGKTSSSSSPVSWMGVGLGEPAPARRPVGLGQTSPQLQWVQEKEITELPPPSAEEASLTQQAGQAIQQGWGAVVRWGGRLSHNLAELSLSGGQNQRQEGIHRDLPELQARAGSDFPRVDGGTVVPWSLGRLFGASRNPSSPSAPPTRRPSQWLAPGVTALTRMVSSSSTPMLRRVQEAQGESEPELEREVQEVEMSDRPRPLRSVRTLCDHSGTGSELSFQKGEELVLLGGVDHDWIRCRQGDQEGLVPIGYTSLIM